MKMLRTSKASETEFYLPKATGRVLHLLTALPPVVCGVGDYGVCLNRKLAEDYGMTPRLYTPPSGDSAGAKSASLRSELQSADAVILEYANYGYQRYGIPYWLLQALSQWKTSGKRLVTVFHELYAVGKPWSTAFWTSPPQRYVTRELALLSDGMITTTDRHAEILRSWEAKIDVRVLPVPSNVGEIRVLPVAESREIELIVFGLAGTRKRVYLQNEANWARIRSVMRNVTVHDIGPPVDLPLAELTGLPCVAHGHVPAPELSAMLGTARWGIVDYYQSTLEKSGVFAAYCAHGVVPIVLRHSTPAGSTLKEGRHFLTPFCCELINGKPSELSQSVHQWYAGHAMAKHARIIHQLLGLKDA
jgi:hypothetical protein